jgi:hypothetical protein
MLLAKKFRTRRLSKQREKRRKDSGQELAFMLLDGDAAQLKAGQHCLEVPKGCLSFSEAYTS